MIGILRHNLRIAAPGFCWTGGFSAVLLALVLYYQFRNSRDFTEVVAASVGEGVIPLIAAFLAAGVLDPELRRGAHEVVHARLAPLWRAVACRLAVSIVLALIAGAIALSVLHFALRPFPLKMVLLASVPGCVVMAAVSLWIRVRLGGVFIGYLAALAVWLANVFAGAVGTTLGIHVNPLLSFSSYTDYLNAAGQGKVAVTPYADWWWVSKVALCVAGAAVFAGMQARLEHLVEGD